MNLSVPISQLLELLVLGQILFHLLRHQFPIPQSPSHILEFFFKNSFRFAEKLRRQYRGFLYLSHPISPIITILCYDALVTNNKPISIHYYQLKSIVYLDFLICCLKPLFYFRVLPGIPCCIQLSLAVTVFLAFEDLDSFEAFQSDIFRMFYQNLIFFSHDIRLRLWVIHRGEVSFSSHHVTSQYQDDL